MSRLSRRDLLILLAAVAVAPAVLLAQAWNAKAARHGQDVAEPFRIAGNFYYVGANDLSAFLITGPEGHVLLDAGYPTTAPLIMASITRLGFKVSDVRVLINSSSSNDFAGGLAAVQQASGASLWASEPGADVIASGGQNPDFAVPLRVLTRVGIAGYPPPRVDHRFKDGDVVRLGPIALTAHVTGGSTRGCTSWSFSVRDGDRELHVVSVCGLDVTLGLRYAQQRDDIERALTVLRGLPADVWVTGHARAWGRYRKFVARGTAKNAADPFIDPEGYRAFLDAAEADFRAGRMH
jgi:metallo-beta-lactamase class B